MKHTNHIGKKILSVILAIAMLLPGAGLFAQFALAASTKSASVTCGDLQFIVPETIYLEPKVNSWTVATTAYFQYYVNNNENNEPLKTRDTTGYIYYSYATASNASLSYRFLNRYMDGTLPNGSVTLSPVSSLGTSKTISITAGLSPSLAYDVTGCYIEWILSFTDTKDNVGKKAYAYTYVYKPYVVPTAAGSTLRCTDGNDHDNSQLTWMSGFHYIHANATTPSTGDSDKKAAYPRYSRVSQGATKAWAFSPFMSYDTGSVKGDINYKISDMGTSGNQNVAINRNGSTKPDHRKQSTAMKLAFADSDNSKSYMKYKDIDNYWAHDWMSESNTVPSDGTPTKTTTYDKLTCSFYYYYSEEDMTSCIDTGGVGGIYIDTSRYSNLNQIPNLGVGMMMTDNQDTSTSDDGAWMIADYTGWQSSTYAGHQGNGDKMRDEWWNVNYYIAGMGHPDNRNGSYDTCNLKYAGNWNRPINSGSEQTYQIKSAQMNNQNGDWITVQVVLKLHAHQYDKSGLRTAVQNAIKKMPALGVNGTTTGIGKPTSCYFDANTDYKWTDFQIAFQKAVRVLGSVDMATGISDSPATLATNLNNALNALCTKVTFNANGGTLSGTATQYVTIGTNQKVNVTPSNLGVSATRSGWTFVGWATSASATSASKTITIGYNQTWYAIWKKTFTVNFYSGINKATNNSQSVTLWNGATSTNITTPTSYTAVWTFKGWTTSTSANSSASTVAAGASVSVTGAATYYALYTQSHTLAYNANGGSGTAPETTTATGYYNSYGSQTNGSHTVAANPFTKTGYSFNGWNTKADGSGTTYAAGGTYTNSTAADTLYAQWTINQYTITFKGANGNVLKTQTVNHGVTPTAPEIPAKSPDAANHYSGAWDKTIASATADTTYTAVYTSTAHSGGTATCTAKAICSSCGTAYGDMLSHSYTGAVKDNGDGTHSRLCVNGCNEYGDTVSCTYGEWKTVQGETCVADGSKYKECSVCHHKVYETIPSPGHSMTKTAANAATCLAAGNNEYYTCSRCNKVFKDAAGATETTVAAETLAQKSHSYTGAFKNNENGTHSFKCVNGCNEYGGTVSCTYGEWDVTKAASATEKGSKAKTCSVCQHKVTEEIALLPIEINFIGTTTDTEQSTYDQTITVPANDEATFICWSSANDGNGTEYQPGATVTVKDLYDDGKLNIYAQYAEEKPIVYDFGIPVKMDYSAKKPTSKDSDTTKTDVLNVLGAIDSTKLGTATAGSIYVKDGDKWNYSNAVPASNVMYEETALTYTKGSKPNWELQGTSSYTQTLSSKNVFGYSDSDAYDDDNGSYSNGTYLETTVVKSTGTISDPATFTFTGEGFDVISACGTDTGILSVKLSGNGVKKTTLVDTYVNADTLTQVPVYHVDDLAYGTYEVTVQGVYLTTAGGAKHTNTGAGAASENAVKADVIAQLDEMGFIIDDPAELELKWCDNDSVLNGGAGNTISANAAANRGDGAASNGEGGRTSLKCVIDGVRIYKPLGDNENGAYDYTETDAEYYNVLDNLTVSDGALPGYTESFIAYIEEEGQTTSIKDYLATGAKSEVYLAASTQAVAFAVRDFIPGHTKVMVSLRAARGTPTAIINGNELSTIKVTSATEMYYDISDLVDYKDEDGVAVAAVLIGNIGDGTLAVNNVKIVQGDFEPAAALSMARMRTFMAAAAPEEPETPTEPEVIDEPTTEPEIPTEPETPIEPEEPSTQPETPTEPETPDQTEEKTNSVIRFFLDLLNKVREFFRKLFG